MNFDIPPVPTPEKETHFLSLSEIKAKIEELSDQENSEVMRTLGDAKGIYLHEVATVDAEGIGSLYSYRRSGNYSETKTSVTNIDVTYFTGKLEDEMFIGGNILSNYSEEMAEWTDEKEF
jgi:hypothetical protein